MANAIGLWFGNVLVLLFFYTLVRKGFVEMTPEQRKWATRAFSIAAFVCAWMSTSFAIRGQMGGGGDVEGISKLIGVLAAATVHFIVTRPRSPFRPQSEWDE